LEQSDAPASAITLETAPLSPEFRAPSKALFLKPARPLAVTAPAAVTPPHPTTPPKPVDDYIYCEGLTVPDDFGEEFLRKVNEPLPKEVYKAPPLSALFSRSSRSRSSLPASVLSQYPSERKQKK